MIPLQSLNLINFLLQNDGLENLSSDLAFRQPETQVPKPANGCKFVSVVWPNRVARFKISKILVLSSGRRQIVGNLFSQSNSKISSASRLSDLCLETALARIKLGLPMTNWWLVAWSNFSNHTSLVARLDADNRRRLVLIKLFQIRRIMKKLASFNLACLPITPTNSLLMWMKINSNV